MLERNHVRPFRKIQGDSKGAAVPGGGGWQAGWFALGKRYRKVTGERRGPEWGSGDGGACRQDQLRILPPRVSSRALPREGSSCGLWRRVVLSRRRMGESGGFGGSGGGGPQEQEPRGGGLFLFPSFLPSLSIYILSFLPSLSSSFFLLCCPLSLSFTSLLLPSFLQTLSSPFSCHCLLSELKHSPKPAKLKRKIYC